jgi:membrane protein YdbS with pleckstrin-like domain
MPWWSVVVIIAIIALMAVIGIYIYRRFRLANHKKNVEDLIWGKTLW